MATITATGSKGHHSFTLTVTEIDYDIATNASTVSFSLDASSSTYDFNWSSRSISYTVTINGVAYTASNGAYPKNQAWTVLSRSGITIPHNDDGTKSIAISFSVVDNINQSYTTGNANASGLTSLTTIPRAGSVDSWICSSSYLNGTFTYIITPKSAFFYNRLRISIPNVVVLEYVSLGQKPATATQGNYTLSQTILASIYNRYPNASSCGIGIVLETYSDANYSNKIGESTELSVLLNFPEDVKPSCSFTYSDITNCFNTFGAFVQQNSRIAIATTVATSYGSPITGYTIEFDGRIYTTQNTTTEPIGSSGTLTIKVKVTDSRGRTSSESTARINVLPYEPPKITLSAYRCTQNGTPAADGSYIKIEAIAEITDLESLNEATYSIRYKTSDSENWSEITGAGTQYASEAINFDVTKTGAVEATFSDRLTSRQMAAAIPMAFTLFDCYRTGKGITFGEVATEEGFVVALDAKFKGQFHVSAMPDYIIESNASGGWYYEKHKNGVVKMYTKGQTSYANSNVLYKTFAYPFELSELICGMATLNDSHGNSSSGLDANVKMVMGVSNCTVWQHNRNSTYNSDSSSQVSVEIIGKLAEEE